MLYKTRGIVLHSLKYSETSIIVRIYTEAHGIVSYIVRASRSKKSAMKPGIFQPLTILDFVAYHRKKTKLQTIKEITHCYHFTSIPYDIKKSSVAIFIAEVLYKTIREEEQNRDMFDFIHRSVLSLDATEGRIAEFHLYFLIELSRLLGFYPHDNFNENNIFFNLYDGHFQEYPPEHFYFIEKELSEQLHKLIGSSYHESKNTGISAESRKELINKLLDYYRIHLSGFNVIHSNQVLEEIFR